MPFPKSYEKELFFDHDEIPENFGLNVIKQISKHGYKLEEDNTSVSYNSQKTIGRFMLPVSIEWKSGRDGVSISIDIITSRLINIIIAVVLLASLSSGFSVSFFFVFSVVFSVLFYAINISFVISECRSIITFAREEKDESEIFSNQQKQWIKDKNKCPACGAAINKYSWQCHNCGIVLRQKRKVSRFNTSMPDKSFNYTLKKTDRGTHK